MHRFANILSSENTIMAPQLFAIWRKFLSVYVAIFSSFEHGMRKERMVLRMNEYDYFFFNLL